MAKKKPTQKFLQMIVEEPIHRQLKGKAALAGMTMIEFVISATENYIPKEKK